jgi:hypothetical protein
MILIDHPYIDKLIIPIDITGNKNHYLYVHYRQDIHEAFYVGVGTKYRKKDYDRALCYKKRSIFWKRIINKTRYNVMIIDESDNYQELLNKEINYIKVLGKKKENKGTLCNLTDGGEGCLGHSHSWSDEMKEKIREANSRRITKDSTREKLRQNIYKNNVLIGRKGKDNYIAKTVFKLDVLTNVILQNFDSAKDAAESIKVTPQHMSKTCRENKIIRGFKWIYKHDNN